MKFPVDAPKKRVIKTLESFGFYDCPRTRAHCDDSGRCRRHENAFDDAESFKYQRLDIENDLQSSGSFAGRFFESV